MRGDFLIFDRILSRGYAVTAKHRRHAVGFRHVLYFDSAGFGED